MAYTGKIGDSGTNISCTVSQFELDSLDMVLYQNTVHLPLTVYRRPLPIDSPLKQVDIV